MTSATANLSGGLGGESENEARRVLITFDVDGTLMRSVGDDSNKLHKKAFSHAFLQVFGIRGDIDAIKHHGSTDMLVAMNTLAHYGISKEKSEPRMAEVREKMLEYAREHEEEEVREGLELLPGVVPLLAALSRLPNAHFGLVTGNLEEIAWMKMKGLGILDLFSKPRFGGFGSDHSERGELVKIAAIRAAALFPGRPFSLRVHVGDTPNDILAAVHGGALPIGVCTGVFTRKELEQVSSSSSSPQAVILDDLSDASAFLQACELTSPSS